jgi:hypothetical protein
VRACDLHFPEKRNADGVLECARNARGDAKMQKQIYAKDRNAQVSAKDIESIVAKAVAAALAGASVRTQAKGVKQRAKKANDFLAWMHSTAEERAARKDANRAMSASIRAQKASAKEVAKFIAAKPEATRATWAKLAKSNGYRL